MSAGIPIVNHRFSLASKRRGCPPAQPAALSLLLGLAIRDLRDVKSRFKSGTSGIGGERHIRPDTTRGPDRCAPARAPAPQPLGRSSSHADDLVWYAAAGVPNIDAGLPSNQPTYPLYRMPRTDQEILP